VRGLRGAASLGRLGVLLPIRGQSKQGAVAARCGGAAELVGRVGIADESGVRSLGGGLDSINAPVG
jgi:hypothetical protein